MVRSRKLELPRSFPHSDLNAARLPIPPRPHARRRPIAPPRAGMAQWSGCLANARHHIKRDGPATDREIGIEPGGVEWRISDELVPYEEAVAEMETPDRGDPRRHRARAGVAAWSTRRSTPPGPARGRRICSTRRACRCIAPAAAGSTPITGRGSASPMSCSIWTRWGRDVRCHVWRLEEWVDPRRWRASTSRASGATDGSASGLPGA